MKKWMKITIGIVGTIALLVIIDLVCIFTMLKPIFAIKEDKGDSVDRIYKGLFYDTYYCHEDSVRVITKGHKFTCAADIKIDKFSSNFDFLVVVTTPTEHKKTFAFTHDGRDYYYGNTDYRLYLTEANLRYDLETSLKNNLITFDSILDKAKNTEIYRDGGSKLYQYNQFEMVVCNTIAGNNDIIIGEPNTYLIDFCQ